MTESRTSITTPALVSPQRPATIEPVVISTEMTLETTPDKAWDRLMFYEQIDARPPFYLRMLLPVPIRTEGRKSEVGDEARCIYEEGHLIKRITQVERERYYGFDVIEQALPLGGGMQLSGGSYTLSKTPEGRTAISLLTRYTSPKRPRWLWTPVETLVCHLFHRHILSAMRRSLRAGAK